MGWLLTDIFFLLQHVFDIDANLFLAHARQNARCIMHAKMPACHVLLGKTWSVSKHGLRHTCKNDPDLSALAESQ